MTTPRDWLQAALDVGPLRAAYRLAWEFDRRSGLKQIRQPTAHVPMPSDVPTWEEWWPTVDEDCWLRDLPVEPATEVCQRRAEAALGGRLRLFGGWTAELGSPPDWHREPLTGRRWSSTDHWSVALEARAGDPRITWEVSRFGHVWDWIRCYRDDGDARWSDAFAEHLESWARQNPYRAGINWASGQELAVRIVAWLAAASTFGGELGAEVFRTLLELLYWHGVHIDSELGFARWAVPNNHLIAEASALATLGTLFDWRESERWRRRGLQLLRRALDEQFHDDGGYCQASHTYHRFALEWLLFARGMFPELADPIDRVCRRSRDYLEALVLDDGGLPNFGPNDGARLWRGDDANERDFRPLLDALPAGPHGADGSRSFPESGLHLLRDGPTAVYLRAGGANRRGGHADQLHLDVWHDGSWLAVDAGSYSYAADEHRWFAGAKSHNGVLVDGRSSVELAGGFTWVGDLDAELVEWDPRRGRAVVRREGAGDYVWEREVRLTDGEIVVIDRMAPAGIGAADERFRLHWLLDAGVEWAGERSVEGDVCVVELRARPVAGRLRDERSSLVSAQQSWYYGTLRPAQSLVFEVTGRGVEFETRFRIR